MRGLLDEQIAELKLVDEELERCEPAGGFVETPDPVGFRVGKAPTSAFQEILFKALKDAEDVMNNAQLQITPKDIHKAMQELKEALQTVYPMGLPEYDPVRMEIENREILAEFHNKELTKVADPKDTKLWFASKELLPGTILRDYLGNNEKTKVIVKISDKQSGQPCREPLLTDREEKLILMQSAKRREEIERMQRNSDDSYHDAPWADQGSLKKRVLGLDNISWKPF